MKIAISARFSTDRQKDSSIAAQISYCKKIARRDKGFSADDLATALTFSDYATSGTKGADERPGYAALLAAWTAGEFDVLLVESQSRLCRDELESVWWRKQIEKTGLRVITCGNLLDTSVAGWQDTWRRCGQQDEDYVVKASKEASRGIIDLFELGFHVGDFPYGYQTVKAEDDGGTEHYKLAPLPDQLKLVRRVFDERLAGQSSWGIARALNADGIKSPKGVLWSAVGIMNMLKNPLYKGFAYYAGELYPRPDCVIVTLEEWQRVQPVKAGGGLTRSGRGSLKSWASGAFGRCPKHNCALSLKSVKGHRYIHCSRCLVEHHLTGAGQHAGYAPTWALQKLLVSILQDAFTPEALAAFRARVADLQVSVPSTDIAAIEKKLATNSRTVSTIVDQIIAISDYPEKQVSLKKKLESLKDEQKFLLARKDFFLNSLPTLDPQVYALQMSIDPSKLLPLAFEYGDQAALSVILPNVFPVVEMCPTSGKMSYTFKIAYSQARAVASLTNTVALLDDMQEGVYVVNTWRNQKTTCYRKVGTELVELAGQTKACTHCGAVHPLSEFYKQNNAGLARVSWCRTCLTEKRENNGKLAA